MWEDDDDNFDPEDPELQREMEKEQQRLENLPVMVKALEIFDLVNALTQTFEVAKMKPDFEVEEGLTADILEHYKCLMEEDAMMMNAKLRGAEATDLYTLRMENATVVKIHARNLLAHASGLKMYGYPNHAYLDMLREEINKFRLLFLDWIASFNKYNDIPDGWGLFYDPDFNYDLD